MGPVAAAGERPTVGRGSTPCAGGCDPSTARDSIMPGLGTFFLLRNWRWVRKLESASPVEAVRLVLRPLARHPEHAPSSGARGELRAFLQTRLRVDPKSDGDRWVLTSVDRFLWAKVLNDWSPHASAAKTLCAVLHRSLTYPEALPPAFPTACALMVRVIEEKGLCSGEALAALRLRMNRIDAERSRYLEAVSQGTFEGSFNGARMRWDMLPISPGSPDFNVPGRAK